MSWGDFVQVVFKLCSSCVQVVTSGQGLATPVFLVTLFSNCVVAMLHSARTCQIVILLLRWFQIGLLLFSNCDVVVEIHIFSFLNFESIQL